MRRPRGRPVSFCPQPPDRLQPFPVGFSTQTRLFLLLGLLVAGFTTSAWLLRRSHAREAANLLHNLTEERQGLESRLLDLNGQSLCSFADDYSFWGEMVTFVRTGDAEWARINIRESLDNFGAHAAWVLRVDGTPVYGVVRELDAGLQKLPVSAGLLLPELVRRRFAHFFVQTSSGLLEVRAAPVQPSEDSDRSTPPQGWFLAARRWDEAFLDLLRQTLNCEVELHAPDVVDATDPDPTSITLHHELSSWQGRPEMILHTRYHPAVLRLLVEENRGEMMLFLGFGVATVLAIGLSLGAWVIRPLRALERSLAGGTAAPLGRLDRRDDEFGRLAGLVAESFRHRATLEQEVAERRRAEDALRLSEEQLRRANAVRTRLARDLHDGAIQSIYAAGMGLEGVRATLRADPAEADRRLDAAGASLNQTIREIRSFITGLEPEETERPPFISSLRALLGTLQTLRPGQLQLELGEAPPRALSAREEIHALQVARECISNALRHGEAAHIAVWFGPVTGRPALVVSDDGRGFDPVASSPRPGSGLANIAARCAEIGADCRIEAAVAKGTRVTVVFAHAQAA